jgi:hypothetical protein
MNEKSRDPASFGDNMKFSFLVKAAELCVSAARDLTKVIIDNVDPDFRRLPAPWYSVFCKSLGFPLSHGPLTNTNTARRA